MLNKKDFPIFEKESSLIYLDAAATSQKPKFVLEEINNWYNNYNANIGRGFYNLSLNAQERYEDNRQIIADIFATKAQEVIFTKGATEGINLIANGLFHLLKPGQSIIVCEGEHHSNYLPWLNLAQRNNLEFKIIRLKNGLVDLEQAKNMISHSTALVAINHASNVLGQINPIEKLSKITKKCNSLLIVDGAQVVPHEPVEPWKLGCDAYVFSGHKVYAENGSGVAFIKTELQSKLNPLLLGGDMVKSVHNKTVIYADGPTKFEGGTQNPAAQLSLGKALTYLSKNWTEIYKNESNLHKSLIKQLEHPLITIHNPEADLPIVTFSIKDIPAHDIGSYLNEQNIAVRVGLLCSQTLVEKLNPNGVVRVSLGLWNTPDDIKRFGNTINNLIKLFNL